MTVSINERARVWETLENRSSSFINVALVCVLGPTFAFEFVWVKADCDELPQTDQQNSWEIFSLLLGCQKSAPSQTGEERNAPRGAANARPTRLRRRRTWSTTKQRCRDGGITFEAGFVADEELRADRSVAASRAARVGMRYQETVLAERRVRANGLSGDSLAEIQRAWHVLGRIARAHELDHELRTALRLRMMALVDRLEVEQAKQRIVEGNFAAARYHLTCRASGRGSCAWRWSRCRCRPG